MKMLRSASDSLILVTPTLIKELRQELRMKTFGLFFILPQVCAAFVLFLQAFNDISTRDLTQLANMVYYGCLLLPLFFLLPARAFASISKDSEAGSLELMSLTKLTTWHIAAGKWLALSALSVLFVSAMVPYALLQYFVGSGDPVLLLGSMFVAWITSLLMMAFVLSSAPLKHRAATWGLGLIFVVLVAAFIIGSILDRKATAITGLLGTPSDFTAFCVMAMIGIFMLIDVTASRFASPVDDFGPRKRVVSFSCIAIVALMEWAGIGIPEVNMIGLIMFALPAVVTSLFEEASPVLSVSTYRRGGGWRWFMSRGWPGGIASGCLIAMFVLWVAESQGLVTAGPLIVLWIKLLAGLLAPYLLLQKFGARWMRNPLAYCIIQGVSLIFIPIFTSIARNGTIDAVLWVGQFTIAGFLFALASDASGTTVYSRTVYASDGIIPATIILIVCVLSLLKRFRALKADVRRRA